MNNIKCQTEKLQLTQIHWNSNDISSRTQTNTTTHVKTKTCIPLFLNLPIFGCLTTSEAEDRWQHLIITDLWNESINVHLKLISLLTHTHTLADEKYCCHLGIRGGSWKVHSYVYSELVRGRWKLVIWAAMFSLKVTNTAALSCCQLNYSVSLTHITCNIKIEIKTLQFICSLHILILN